MGLFDAIMSALFVMLIVFVVLVVLWILIKLFTSVIKIFEDAKNSNTEIDAKSKS